MPICGAACDGADPTPSHHAIQPRPTVGGNYWHLDAIARKEVACSAG